MSFGRGKMTFVFKTSELPPPEYKPSRRNQEAEIPGAILGDDKFVKSTDTEAGSAEPVTSGFGSFSWNAPPIEKQKENPVGPKTNQTPAEEQMARIMGFTDFATSKKEREQTKSAKKFDVKEMVEAIKKARKVSEGKTDETIESAVENIELTERDSRKSGDEDDEDDEIAIGPNPAPAPKVEAKISHKEKMDKDDSSDDDDEEADDNEEDSAEYSDDDSKYVFPVTDRLNLIHGSRPVSALCVDPAATRFATGSYDYEVKLWDFTGLKNRHAFRSMRPCESHPIRNVSYSSSGDSLLIISGNAQAKVVDRDGTELLECVKGDQYIVDMARTSGHTASLSGGQFNPKQKGIFLTSSDDGTCRLWDVNNPRQHKTVVKMKSSSGLKNPATTCCFGRDGNTFIGAGFDGTMYMWDTRKPLVMPTVTVKNAHQKNTETFAVTYSNSGLQVASRGEDAVVNIYDTRNWKQTLWKATNQPAKYNTTDLTFSPDDRFLLIPSLPEGVNGRIKDEAITHSVLHFLSMSDLEFHNQIVFPGEIVIRTAWNHRINQIFVTYASGGYSILYDTKLSIRGAMLSHGKEPKREKPTEVIEDLTNRVIITPNALPMFKADKPRNKRREEMKARMDPTKSKRPDLPITAGSGGRVATAGSTLSSYVIRNLGLSKSVKDDMDPREAILRYAKDAAENPIWVTPAYKITQPKPIFAKQDEEDESPDSKKQKLM